MQTCTHFINVWGAGKNTSLIDIILKIFSNLTQDILIVSNIYVRMIVFSIFLHYFLNVFQ